MVVNQGFIITPWKTKHKMAIHWKDKIWKRLILRLRQNISWTSLKYNIELNLKRNLSEKKLRKISSGWFEQTSCVFLGKQCKNWSFVSHLNVYIINLSYLVSFVFQWNVHCPTCGQSVKKKKKKVQKNPFFYAIVMPFLLLFFFWTFVHLLMEHSCRMYACSQQSNFLQILVQCQGYPWQFHMHKAFLF